MAFLAQTLLDCVAMGVKGGPGFLTDVVMVRSGHESRNQLWIQARHRWDIGMVARPRSEFEIIKAAFMAVGGRRDGFLWVDPFDSEIGDDGALLPLHGSDVVGTAGFGYGTPTYQLGKVYATGANSYSRDIRKPRTYAITRGGSPVSPSVATTTGVVTFTADQSKAISSHTPMSGHVFTLASAFSPNLAIGGRIFVTGVTGTAATLLNDLSHEVTGVSSAVITTSTSTTGLTASGGTAYYYPQPTEALLWTGNFYVPVRFDVDQFDGVVIDRQGSGGEVLIELPSIPIIEIRV